MTPADLLADLSRRGVGVRPNGDRLRLDALPGVLTPDVLAAVAAHKPALLTLLSGWDQARADRALADVNARLDAVLAAGAGPARRRVAEVYQDLAAGYHARRDPLLFEVGPALDRKGWGP